MRNHIVFIIIFIALVLVTFIQQPLPRLSLDTNTLPEIPHAVDITPVHLRDVSLDWQLVSSHQQTSAYLSSLTETLGSGVCVIDVNQDGWMDIFFVGGGGLTRDYGRKSWWMNSSGNRLLINQHGKYFIDATTSAGLMLRHHGMGCSVADLNNDGFSDLFVTGVGENYLYRNNGDGSFTDVSALADIQGRHWSTAASFADFNADGLIDIYVTNYVQYRKGRRTFEDSSGFKSTGDISFDPSLYDSESNYLYINQGEFKFTEQAAALAVSNSQGRSLGARWFDVNNDNWLDLLVINDHGSSNKLFLNNYGKSFTPASEIYSAFEIDGAHDVQISDFDKDGHTDYFMTRGKGLPPVLLINNQLQQSDGSIKHSLFSDLARDSGLALPESLPLMSWAATQGDFNNDGYQDLYVANGSTRPDIDSRYVPMAQSNELFINTGQGDFIFQQPNKKYPEPASSRGSISVDLDNDGFLEILVSNNNDQLQILKNTHTTGNWIGLEFSNNLDVENFGALITVQTKAATTYSTLRPAQGFLSQGDPRMLMGLGDADTVKQLSIRWNDNSSSHFSDLQAGFYYRVDRSTASIEQLDNDLVDKIVGISTNFKGYSDDALIDLASILFIDPSKNSEIINSLWLFSSVNVKVGMLSHINKGMDKNLIRLPLKALSFTEPEVLLPAIEIIRKAELETSVGRLIPLFQHPDNRVKCATANAFQFFFDEEEAVTHRKTLALSPLIRLLESSDNVTAICAANALASAEKQRAVLPLLVQLDNRRNDMVQAAMIRALGLIRDTRAIVPLRSLVKNSQSSPSVIASGLIALSRLKDPQINSIIEGIAVEQEGRSLATRYDILTQLYKKKDGGVFSRKVLTQTFEQLYSQHDLSSKQNITSMLKAIGQGGLSEYAELLRRYSLNTDKTIRNSALISLAELGIQTSRQYFEQALDNLSLTEQIEILLSSELSAYVYPTSYIATLGKNLLLQLNESKQSGQQLFQILQNISTISAAKLLESVLPAIKSELYLLPVFDICKKRSLKVDNIRKSLLTDFSVDVGSAYLSCVYRKKSTVSQMQNFKLNLILKKIFNDTAVDEQLKTRLMIKFSTQNNIIAKKLLFKKLPKLIPDTLINALSALQKVELTPLVETFLWDILDKEKNQDLRMKAALVLARINGGKVQSQLHKEYLH